MMTRNKLNKFDLAVIILISAVLTINAPPSFAVTGEILNPGFENSFSEWDDTDPSSISSLERSGSRSAKISGGKGRVSQTINVEQNSEYTLSAYVRGSGSIGLNVNGVSTIKNVSNSSGWTQAQVTVSTGSHTTLKVFAKYYKKTGRFDDFVLTKVASTPNPDPEPTACTGIDDLSVLSASDNGTNDGNGPSNAIDGKSSTRWSSKGAGKVIDFDLGQISNVKELAVSWYKGSSRVAFFDVRTSENNSTWTTVLGGASSYMNGGGLENYAINETQARYLRIIGGGNSSNEWNSILEVSLKGCTDGNSNPPQPEPTPPTDGLNPNLPPSGNFELVDWNISIPVDNDGNGKADTIKEVSLSSGFNNSNFFYTASDGGMVFKVPVKGAKTSANTSYTRTELREMLRRGDTSYPTKGVGKNNWVLGSAPGTDRTAAGGVDGTLTGTLAVNHVTTTGSDSQVGRVIFAQIHANDDEPLRFYYRKLPNNSKASIYFAHEPRGGSDVYYEMIGSRSKSEPNPPDGIELNEKFSYEVKTVGNTLTVKLIRDGKPDLIRTVNMSNSGYDSGGQYMYFKAGAYIQDNTGNDNDYALLWITNITKKQRFIKLYLRPSFDGRFLFY